MDEKNKTGYLTSANPENKPDAEAVASSETAKINHQSSPINKNSQDETTEADCRDGSSENSQENNSPLSDIPAATETETSSRKNDDDKNNSADSALKDNLNPGEEKEDTARADSEKNSDSKKSGNKEKKKDLENEDQPMGLFDHLNELRSRLIKSAIAAIFGFGICWAFVDPIFTILVSPLLNVLPDGSHAQYTTLPEAFFIRMQIAFVAGLFVASPIIFYQIWAFIAPGLYEEEKRYIIPIALLSAIFFAGGACFCYYIVFPFAFNFFISYSTPEIVITPKISDYISFVLKLIFAFGLIFEMPIFTLFLARMGVITAKLMRRMQKYAIVIIFILAAILTPPDVVSQLLMACPMLALYEISIGVAAIFGKKQNEQTS